MEYIQKLLAEKLGFSHDDGEDTEAVLKTADFHGLANHWKENGFKKIVTMVGAGISTCKINELLKTSKYLRFQHILR